MGPVEIIVLVSVILIFTITITTMVVRKKKGKKTFGCNCGDCNGSCSECNARRIEQSKVSQEKQNVE